MTGQLQLDKVLVVEARTEVNAARQNLKEAITVWERTVASLHPAALLLEAAQHRLDRANALLRSVLGDNNHDGD